jgi:hypothetical protein
MINSVMINEEKVDKRKSPPYLAHFTPLKVNYFDTRLWLKMGDLSGSTTVLCCRGSGCRGPPTTRPRLVWAGSATRSLAFFVTETRQGPFDAWEAGCGVEGGGGDHL